MASKFLSFFPLFMALAIHISTLSVAQSNVVDGVLPVIDIISAVADKNAPQIRIRVRAGGNFKGAADLSAGQEYQLNVDVNGIYYASAIYGLKFTSFQPYEPIRDKGQSAIYWRVNDLGFDISYDKTNWKQLAPWQSE
ncbi:hypothetical protein BUALT_Bualt14G0044200 [Buddleja alternifolia]|uniref:Uncharacterized protein n=1 Tax=Buddleja alternifolia TaxID=168488 RepID=A0AAV6WRT9_9LAMI|nr:hypothetical protein BUALT_Bualt14G0044200 [Buddleja alternifolia]